MRRVTGGLVVLGVVLWACVAGADEPPALGEQLRELSALSDRVQALQKQVREGFTELLPKGRQSYGEFEWSCFAGGSFITVAARDGEGRQHIWVQVFYLPEVSDELRNSFTKRCAGYPAKRMKDKWVWVLVNRVELRFGLNDPALEDDATLEAIVKSFDLDTISKL